MSLVRTLTLPVVAAVIVLGLGGAAGAAVPEPSDDPTFVDVTELSPRLKVAMYDRPRVAHLPCNYRGTEVARFCIRGDRDSSRIMVGFGDSHVIQWFSAVRRTAKAGGYRLLWTTKPSCPAAAVRVLDRETGLPYRACRMWRASLFEQLADLPHIDLAVMASSSWLPMLYPGTRRQITSSSDRAEAWRSGTARTIRALKPNTRRIMLIRDTPRLWVDAPGCLRSSGGDTRPCSQARSSALQTGLWMMEKRLDERFERVRAVQFTRAFCTSTTCRPVTDSLVLRYRDDNHMTDTFATELSDVFAKRVRQVLR